MAGAAFLWASTVFFATPKRFRHKLMNQSCALVFMANVTQPSLWQIKMEICIPQYTLVKTNMKNMYQFLGQKLSIKWEIWEIGTMGELVEETTIN